MSERPIIVFDVNETLLNLDAIQPIFNRIFDDPAAMRLWFGALITYSEALTLAGVYVPFTDIGGAVLRMLAATRDITISDADAAELTTTASACLRSPTTRWRSPGGSCSTRASSICSSVGSAPTAPSATSPRRKPMPMPRASWAWSRKTCS